MVFKFVTATNSRRITLVSLYDRQIAIKAGITRRHTSAKRCVVFALARNETGNFISIRLSPSRRSGYVSLLLCVSCFK